MLRLKNLNSTVLIRLMIFAIGFSPLGCCSSNSAPRGLVSTQRSNDGVRVDTHSMRTTVTNPMTAGKHKKVDKTDSIGDTLNGAGHVLADAIKFSGEVAIVTVAVGARIIADLFIDYQRWRLADKMF